VTNFGDRGQPRRKCWHSKSVRRGAFAVASLLLSGCVSGSHPPQFAKLMGSEKYQWEFASGEEAIDRKGDDLTRLPGVTPEQKQAVIDKVVKGEKLTGRSYYVYRGWPKPDRVKNLAPWLQWYSQPVAKRASNRNGTDEEWEYDWCVIYFRRNRVADLQFKETPNEPRPIYRWSGKVLESRK
jgi:hypothetical protein